MLPLKTVAGLMIDKVVGPCALSSFLEMQAIDGAPALFGQCSLDGSQAIHDVAYKGGDFSTLASIIQKAKAVGYDDDYINVRMFKGKGNDERSPPNRASIVGTSRRSTALG